MKAAWTRLARIIQKKGGPIKYRDDQFNDLFMRHHRNAESLIYNKEGTVLAAVYITPIGSHQESVKAIMRGVQERTQYAYEMEEYE